MKDQAAFSYSDGSFPMKGHEQDYDVINRQECDRKQADTKASNLEQQLQVAKRNAQSTIAWFRWAKKAKRDVKETNDDIAHLHQRLAQIRPRLKSTAFCQKLSHKNIDELLRKLDHLMADTTEVKQILENWQTQNDSR